MRGGAVAGGEDPCVAGRGERVVDGEEAVLVERQAGVGEPRRGARLGDDEHRVGLLPLAVLEPDRAALDALGAGVLEQPDAAALEDRAQPRRAASAWPARISSLVASVTCRLAALAISRSRWSIASASSTPPAPPPITTTLSGPSQRLHAIAELEPAPAQLGDRLDRDRPLLGAGDAADVGRRADIDRQQVVGHGGLVLQQHPPVGAIDAGRLGMDQPRARAGAERARSIWHSSKL